MDLAPFTPVRCIVTLAALCLVVGMPLSAAAIGMTPCRVLSTNGSDRATRLVQANKIVTYEGKTHVAWLDWLADSKISTFDINSGLWSPTTTIGTGQDNHGGPALAVDSNGYLHTIFGPHAGPFQYKVSAQPNNSSSWNAQPGFAPSATYPSFVIDANDTLHLTYRGSGSTLYPLNLVYQRLPKNGTWSARGS